MSVPTLSSSAPTSLQSDLQAQWAGLLQRCLARRNGSASQLARDWGVGESRIRTWASRDCRERISLPRLETLLEISPRFSPADLCDLLAWLAGGRAQVTPAAEEVPGLRPTLLNLLERAIAGVGIVQHIAHQLVSCCGRGSISAEESAAILSDATGLSAEVTACLHGVQTLALRPVR